MNISVIIPTPYGLTDEEAIHIVGWALKDALPEPYIVSGGRLATPALREHDARSFPHDEPCPRCGRRQWGLGPLTADPMNPTDKEQATCGACGYEGEL